MRYIVRVTAILCTMRYHEPQAREFASVLIRFPVPACRVLPTSSPSSSFSVRGCCALNSRSRKVTNSSPVLVGNNFSLRNVALLANLKGKFEVPPFVTMQ